MQLKGILECNGCVQPEISTEGGSCLVLGRRILDNYRRHVPAHRDGESEERSFRGPIPPTSCGGSRPQCDMD